ncbi:aminotransferase class IV [Arundinibacter roseus]|uniref:4-amino-4-deoxychorismate lyase n=1 Tax=Arundinibacter roseus TaxID=2070510 RepID=A0A4R4KAD4_9BACT|nr:aminotransferase class IV [Arundinibacter roseus]TDB63622.1 hypothetical protein EZE20_15065 [Arundinibacter roseus]
MPHLPLCIETICVKNRQWSDLLPWHQARMNRTRAEIWGEKQAIFLTDFLPIPEELSVDTHKCRIIYGSQILRAEWEKYERRPIKSIRVVEDNSINYSYKYQDRESLQSLFEKRSSCDDVLIVKNGCITDTSYANVAFFDGSIWQTPHVPLLPGTRRADLLDKGIIETAAITIPDLSRYSHIRLLNAMMDWDESPLLPIQALQY